MSHSARFLGFTLIELLIVMAITGVLIAIVAPQINGYSNNQKLQAEAVKLQTALRSAQSKATSGVTCNGTIPASSWYFQITSFPSRYKIASICRDGNAGLSFLYDIPENIQLKELKINTSADPCDTPTTKVVSFNNITGTVSFLSSPIDIGCPIHLGANTLTITMELADHSQTKDVTIEKGGTISVQSP